jgi:hypothetical protein
MRRYLHTVFTATIRTTAKKNQQLARRQWLMPVLLAESGGSWFEASPREIVLETLSQKNSISTKYLKKKKKSHHKKRVDGVVKV